MRFALISLGLLIALQACASSRTAATDNSVTRTSTARRSNVITLEEINEDRQVVSLLDLVRRLRPGWPRTITVFINNDPYGDYESLRTLAASSTREMRYLTASEAQMKWGSRFQEVIQVIPR